MLNKHAFSEGHFLSMFWAEKNGRGPSSTLWSHLCKNIFFKSKSFWEPIRIDKKKKKQAWNMQQQQLFIAMKNQGKLIIYININSM